MSKRGQPVVEVVKQLKQWRRMVYKRDHARAMYDSKAILDDNLIASLSSYGHMTRATQQQLLADHWIWWDRYSDELARFIETLGKIPFIPIPSTKKVDRPPSTACTTSSQAGSQPESGEPTLHAEVPEVFRAQSLAETSQRPLQAKEAQLADSDSARVRATRESAGTNTHSTHNLNGTARPSSSKRRRIEELPGLEGGTQVPNGTNGCHNIGSTATTSSTPASIPSLVPASPMSSVSASDYYQRFHIAANTPSPSRYAPAMHASSSPAGAIPLDGRLIPPSQTPLVAASPLATSYPLTPAIHEGHRRGHPHPAYARSPHLAMPHHHPPPTTYSQAAPSHPHPTPGIVPSYSPPHTAYPLYTYSPGTYQYNNTPVPFTAPIPLQYTGIDPFAYTAPSGYMYSQPRT
ncbi:hypothetical protein K474DRAFT_1711101 [Panus rudis PR-1116 ss-1]|nr:hypothetical protein K474DRAFT_1711101 [Panus rudis PR-1116 ss-1]